MLYCLQLVSSLLHGVLGQWSPQPQLPCVLQLYFKDSDRSATAHETYLCTLHELLFCLFVGCCRVACEILLPRPRIVLMPPSLRVWSLDHRTSRKVPGRTLEFLSPLENFQDPKPQFQVPAVHFLCDPPEPPSTPSGLCGLFIRFLASPQLRVPRGQGPGFLVLWHKALIYTIIIKRKPFL